MIKVTYDKPTASIILNADKLKVFLLRYGARESCPLSPLLFKIVLEVLVRTMKQAKKGIQIRKEKGKLSLFVNNVILYTGKLKDSTERLLEFIRVW